MFVFTFQKCFKKIDISLFSLLQINILFIPFKNAFKNKFCLPLLQIKIFIFFPLELFFKIIPILSYYLAQYKKKKKKKDFS